MPLFGRFEDNAGSDGVLLAECPLTRPGKGAFAHAEKVRSPPFRPVAFADAAEIAHQRRTAGRSALLTSGRKMTLHVAAKGQFREAAAQRWPVS